MPKTSPPNPNTPIRNAHPVNNQEIEKSAFTYFETKRPNFAIEQNRYIQGPLSEDLPRTLKKRKRHITHGHIGYTIGYDRWQYILPVPPRVLDDTAQHHKDTGPVVAMSVQEGLSSQALTQWPRREIEEYNSIVFEQLRVEDRGLSKRQIAQLARRENEAHIDFNQVAQYTSISFPTTPIRKTPKDSNESSTVPPTVLDDTAQRHQDMGPKVVILVQQGLSSQVLAQRPRRKFEENNFVAFERLPVQDKGLSRRQITQHARREKEGIFAHTTPTVPSPVPVANGNVLSTEEDLLSNVIPIPPFSHTHETDNFPSLRSFEIDDTSRTRVNMFSVDFNDQCVSSEDENCQRNDIRGVGLQMGQYFLGQLVVSCIHCFVLHWLDEKLSHSSILNPRFGQCCFQGKIRLPTLDPLPTELQELYDGNGILSRSF
ncbi:hypothetical protein GIB67_001517 [Kingdonia uniflora]|uniref:Uncharacterized protein n=1 Tax=Kingdonia uniflora TaxID=39325 RepID=A0A7J7LZC6_9MAGN|nr:hypothetical protein GIB67_001517 [Kingdonia uniflora]